MSIEQLEEQIQQLPPADLVRLAAWFSDFMASRATTNTQAESEWRETAELVAELDRRLAEYTANPDIATVFEPDYFESLKRQLANERAQKASAR